MKNKILIALAVLITLFGFSADSARAEGGIFATGGGSVTVGQTFTVTVKASGATFDSVQGTISVSGPADVVSFTAGSATWLPGKTPANGSQFVGMVSTTSSLTVATIRLRAKSEGSGAVTIAGSQLAYQGNYVGTASGNASFSVRKAPSIPGNITIASTTHPDQNASYDATTVAINWSRPTGATGFSYLVDESDSTTPPTTISSNETTASFENLSVGTHYFHIRAQGADGWGEASHFKINIKAPDPSLNTTLAKPTDISINFAPNYINDITTGTVTGVTINGKVEPTYTANVTLDPAPVIPEGKSLSSQSNNSGLWEVLLDYPIKSGFYKLIVQGQNDQTLTPKSDEIAFEISQAKGGNIAILTAADSTTNPVASSKTSLSQSKPAQWLNKAMDKPILFYSGIVFVLIVIATGTFALIKRKKRLGATYDIMNFNQKI